MLLPEVVSGGVYYCQRKGREQRFLCADLEVDDTIQKLKNIFPPYVSLVYSDPPWNPGNATYWRTHAKKDRCESYDRFLDAVVSVVSECVTRGALDVFIEQSANPNHNGLFLDAMIRAKTLPLYEKWRVYYKAGSKYLPNTLLHFGNDPIHTDPSDMSGEPMTVRVCAGSRRPPGSWVVDMCMGKGTTSRMAHYFDWNAVGVELNPKRLAHTIKWLAKQGYGVEAR